uniref:Uncharacterized protein n=1 Tax=Acrobeloides nanus TaxID=290746 RepID=A0A914D728_9BILA
TVSYIIPGVFLTIVVSTFWSALFEVSFSKLEMSLIRHYLPEKKKKEAIDIQGENNHV